MKLLIYSPKISPRIKYTFNFIFREILRCEFEFTSIRADFEQSTAPKISYAEKALGDELFFCCSPLLMGHNIEQIAITTAIFGDQEVPFAVNNSVLPFDVFAASFYFLSRYEEYLPFTADVHGRYPAEQSLQYRLNLLETPVIDNWALILKNILLKKFPNLTFGKREFKFIPSIDVDRAYHFRSSGLVKNIARVLKLNTEKKDYLAEIHERYQLTPSRQHFLKLHLPYTYLKLIKAGVNHDYSMGYASQIGFKAGTCTPFFWYDLQLEKQSHLTVHPFSVMDVTLQHYLHLNPEQAIAKLDQLMASVKLVDGTFCSLWHNESVSETGRWKGWKVVYEEMLKNTVG